MLAQDYILKQLTASLMYPEKDLGKKFWDRIYKKAREQYGTAEIPVDTFNKVWIVPDKAVVYEHGTSVFVVESHLRVMLEEDYAAVSHQKESENLTTEDRRLTTQVIREIILPALEKEVNEGKVSLPCGRSIIPRSSRSGISRIYRKAFWARSTPIKTRSRA